MKFEVTFSCILIYMQDDEEKMLNYVWVFPLLNCSHACLECASTHPSMHFSGNGTSHSIKSRDSIFQIFFEFIYSSSPPLQPPYFRLPFSLLGIIAMASQMIHPFSSSLCLCFEAQFHTEAQYAFEMDIVTFLPPRHLGGTFTQCCKSA